jgi:hypothetical protein
VLYSITLSARARNDSGTPAVTHWPTRASIPERCRLISAIARSIRLRATPRWLRAGSGTFGGRCRCERGNRAKTAGSVSGRNGTNHIIRRQGRPIPFNSNSPTGSTRFTIRAVKQLVQPAYRFRCGASQSRLAWSKALRRRSPRPYASSLRLHRR